MKRWIKYCLVYGSALYASTVFAVTEGDVFPAVTVSHVDGKPPLAMTGKVTILNFWATWCESCKVELKEMQKEFADLKGVAIGYVSMDKDPVKARKWMAESFGDNSPMIADLYTDASFAIADKLGVDSFPMTVLVDKSGKIVKIQRGFKEGQGSTKIMADLAKSL